MDTDVKIMPFHDSIRYKMDEIRDQYEQLVAAEIKEYVEKLYRERSRVIDRFREVAILDSASVDNLNEMHFIFDELDSLREYADVLSCAIVDAEKELDSFGQQGHYTVFRFSGSYWIKQSDYDAMIELRDKMDEGKTLTDYTPNYIIIRVKRRQYKDLLNWEFGEEL